MKVTVDFEECLKDSPRFRAALEEVEGDVAELELKLDKVTLYLMIDTGKAFCVINKQFVNGIRLAQYSSRDAVVETSLTKFSESLQEMINFHTVSVMSKFCNWEGRGQLFGRKLEFSEYHLPIGHRLCGWSDHGPSLLFLLLEFWI
uniref:Arf-GAP with coiled-coil, ANK repeat and PH domain-containing protein n=1 Tax=Sarcophilus harrisii TaxID=9305 RepID=A0A7N4PSK3_SARHA